jgi:hypothetical protein
MGIVRWASGREGSLAALGDEEADEEANDAAASASSWGGKVGDMLLIN